MNKGQIVNSPTLSHDLTLSTWTIHGPNNRLAPAFEMLATSYRYARELSRSNWDFAVEIAELQAIRLTNSDFRWMVCNGFVEHACEITEISENGRVFRESGDLTFTKKTCFVLTETGARLVERYDETAAFQAHVRPSTRQADKNGVTRTTPKWDHDRRELRLGGRLVKQFKLPSPNQEAVLVAFEEEGWLPRVDDPLPYHSEQSPKRRLHDTIRSLNRNQKHRLIQFKGDGTGQGILWEPIPDELNGHAN